MDGTSRRKSVFLTDGGAHDEDSQGGPKASHPGARRESVAWKQQPNVKGDRRTLRNVAQSFTAIFGMRNRLLNPTPELKKPVKLENTYRMSPEEEFQPSLAEKAINEILQDELQGAVYDENEATEKTMELSDLIKMRVKTLGFTRHRIVCNVVLGQSAQQDISLASRCAWDDRNDNWACAKFQNNHIFAVAMVYAVYFE